MSATFSHKSRLQMMALHSLYIRSMRICFAAASLLIASGIAVADGAHNNGLQATSPNDVQADDGQEQATTSKSELLQIFAATHDGWSLDEVLIRDDLRTALMKSFRESGGTSDEKEVFENLIAIRKSGNLKVPTTKTSNVDTDAYSSIAEIVARQMIDLHSLSLDHVFIDPVLLAEFDRFVRVILPEADLYQARKAALRLRKSRRLQPELLARVTDWKVSIESMPLEEATKKVEEISQRPGVYIFRDLTGYLYIGQSKNLRDRLRKHLDSSDRIALADYLNKSGLQDVTLEMHIFADGSPAEQTVIREAYESELIRIRKPRLNLSP